jgi:hypothetical protein
MKCLSGEAETDYGDSRGDAILTSHIHVKIFTIIELRDRVNGNAKVALADPLEFLE